MTSEVRWLALLPDPVTGLDQPVLELGTRKPMVWVAVDQTAAKAQVKAALTPAQYRLAAVVSVVDWEARSREPQRSKLLHEPGAMFGGTNPKQRCWYCGAPTDTRSSKYCRQHRWRRRLHEAEPKYADD